MLIRQSYSHLGQNMTCVLMVKVKTQVLSFLRIFAFSLLYLYVGIYFLKKVKSTQFAKGIEFLPQTLIFIPHIFVT